MRLTLCNGSPRGRSGNTQILEDAFGRGFLAASGEQETRVCVLGHLQRGGSPTAHDRILATNFGALAVQLCAEEKFGMMVALQGAQYVGLPIQTCIAKLKTVPREHRWVQAAKAVGVSFGDA